MPVDDFQIPNVPPRNQYVATNGQTDFVISFRFFEDEDVKVRIDDNGDPENSSTYTITGAGTNANGTLSFNSGRTAGEIVTIYRDSNFQRVSNFQDSGDWQASNVNDQFNRITTYLQEVAYKANTLGVTLPVTTQLSGIEFPDEGAATNADKIIAWSADGTELINGPTVTELNSVFVNIDDVSTVADEIGNVVIVATDLDGSNAIGTVAAISSEVVNVSSISTEIVNVEAALAAIQTNATNISDINGAYGNAQDAISAKTQAEAARDATLAAFDSFDDRYLGAKAADPATDNDGDPLVAGMIYFNTTSDAMKVYTGSMWVAAYVSGADFLVKAQNLADLPNAATARTNLGLAALAQKATIDGAGLVDDGVLTFTKLNASVLASQAEAEAGTATDKLMNPLRTAQAVAALAGGGLVLLGSYTASNATSVDIGSGLDLDAAIDGTYDEYLLVPVNVRPVSSGAIAQIVVSSNLLSTDITGYKFSGEGRVQTIDVAANSSGTELSFPVSDETHGQGTSSYFSGLNGRILFTDLALTSSVSGIDARTSYGASYNSNASSGVWSIGGGIYHGSAINSIRFKYSTGNIASGKFYLYGIRKS